MILEIKEGSYQDGLERNGRQKDLRMIYFGLEKKHRIECLPCWAISILIMVPEVNPWTQLGMAPKPQLTNKLYAFRNTL